MSSVDNYFTNPLRRFVLYAYLFLHASTCRAIVILAFLPFITRFNHFCSCLCCTCPLHCSLLKFYEVQKADIVVLNVQFPVVYSSAVIVFVNATVYPSKNFALAVAHYVAHFGRSESKFDFLSWCFYSCTLVLWLTTLHFNGARRAKYAFLTAFILRSISMVSSFFICKL